MNAFKRPNRAEILRDLAKVGLFGLVVAFGNPEVDVITAGVVALGYAAYFAILR